MTNHGSLQNWQLNKFKEDAYRKGDKVLYKQAKYTLEKEIREANGAFPLHGTTRFGTTRLSSGRFVFPLQLSTALEWAGLFTCRL